MSTYSKTIKSLRSSGKRNDSPIKRADGGPVPDPDDADALATQGIRKFGNALGIGMGGAALGGSGAGAALAIDKTKKELGRGPIGKVGKVGTGIPLAIGVGLAAEAMKRAGSAGGDLAEAARLRKTPPQSRPPNPERKRGGRVTKRK